MKIQRDFLIEVGFLEYYVYCIFLPKILVLSEILTQHILTFGSLPYIFWRTSLALHGNFEQKFCYQYFIYGKRISLNFCEPALPVIITFSKNYLSGAKRINFSFFTSIILVTYSKEEFVPSFHHHPPCSLKRILPLR